MEDKKTKKPANTKKPVNNKKGMTIHQRRTLEGLMFISPWIIGALLFFVYPIVLSLRMSFSTLDNLAGIEMTWCGIENYRKLIMVDTTYIPNFIKTIQSTVINTPITLVFSLIIAMLINRDIKGRGFFRTVFFIPVLLGTGYVMEYLLEGGTGDVVTNSVDGIVTGVLMKAIGPTFAGYVQIFLSTITVVLWKSGVQIILFLAGLQGISGSLYEAARCDGATEWENFWKITLPLVSPIILLNFIYTMIDSFTDSSNAIISNINHAILGNAQLTLGAAMAWMYFAFTLIVCGIVLAIMSRLTFNIGER